MVDFKHRILLLLILYVSTSSNAGANELFYSASEMLLRMESDEFKEVKSHEAIRFRDHFLRKVYPKSVFSFENKEFRKKGEEQKNKAKLEICQVITDKFHQHRDRKENASSYMEYVQNKAIEDVSIEKPNSYQKYIRYLQLEREKAALIKLQQRVTELASIGKDNKQVFENYLRFRQTDLLSKMYIKEYPKQLPKEMYDEMMYFSGYRLEDEKHVLNYNAIRMNPVNPCEEIEVEGEEKTCPLWRKKREYYRVLGMMGFHNNSNDYELFNGSTRRFKYADTQLEGAFKRFLSEPYGKHLAAHMEARASYIELANEKLVDDEGFTFFGPEYNSIVAREGKVRSDRLSGSGIGKIKIKHSLSNDQIPLEHYGAYIGYAMDDAVEKSHKEAKKIGNEKNFDPNQIEKKFIKDYFSEEAALISGDIENISNEMKSINGDYIAINKALEEKKRFCFQEIGHLISLCSNFGNDLLANCSIKKGKMKGKYSGLKCKKIASTPADIHQVIIDPSLVENVSEADMISYTVHLNNGVNGNRPHQSKAAASSTANDT